MIPSRRGVRIFAQAAQWPIEVPSESFGVVSVLTVWLCPPTWRDGRPGVGVESGGWRAWWHVERTHAWQDAFHRLARCCERRATVTDAFFDLADTIITARSLIRRAWTTHRWGAAPAVGDGPPSAPVGGW